MNIKIICVGNLKEKYLRDACGEYIKRLKRYCSLIVVELSETKISENAGSATIEQAKKAESNLILSALNKNDYVVALDIDGVSMGSEKFAEVFSKNMNLGKSSFCFVIGGSNGFDKSVKKRADICISFSKLTFPHQLFRVFLLEQIFRAMKILKGERYHK